MKQKWRKRLNSKKKNNLSKKLSILSQKLDIWLEHLNHSKSGSCKFWKIFQFDITFFLLILSSSIIITLY